MAFPKAPELLPFLRLTASAPGLPGPYLMEHMGPYHLLETYGDSRPVTIISIGSASATDEILLRHPRMGLVIFEYRPSSASRPPQRMKYYPSQATRLLRSHEIQLNALRETKIEFSVCCEILAPYSDLVALHVSGVGGREQAIELLSFWALVSIQKALPRCQVLVIKDKNFDESRFVFDLTVHLHKHAQWWDYSAAFGTFKNTKDVIRNKFSLLFHSQPSNAMARAFRIASTAFHDQEIRGRVIPGQHVSTIVQKAIAQYTQDPQLHFSPALALRRQLRKDLKAAHISACVEALVRLDVNQSRLLASACWLDALLTNLSALCPDRVFKELYARPLDDCTSILGHDRKYQVQIEYQYLSACQSRNTLRAWVDHLTTVQSYEKIVNLSQTKWCNICLFQKVVASSACCHGLCKDCLMMWRASQSGRGHSICPLCPSAAQWPVPPSDSLAFAPLTAGVRVLKMQGKDPNLIWRQLKQLQQSVGLTGYSLRKFFDVITASGAGLFFLVAIFLEGWTLADCRHHIPHLFKKSPRTRRGKLLFGKSLVWDLAALRIHHWDERKEDKNVWCNIPLTVAKRWTRHDVAVHIGRENEPFDTNIIQKSLFATMFYVSLQSRFEICGFVICFLELRCRVPPGQSLLDLLYRLKRNAARIRYRGSEDVVATTALCNEQVLEACRNRLPYSKRLMVTANLAKETSVEVSLQWGGGTSPISNCPYPVHSLIEQSGSFSITPARVILMQELSGVLKSVKLERTGRENNRPLCSSTTALDVNSRGVN